MSPELSSEDIEDLLSNPAALRESREREVVGGTPCAILKHEKTKKL
jgi:hypothetical protein